MPKAPVSFLRNKETILNSSHRYSDSGSRITQLHYKPLTVIDLPLLLYFIYLRIAIGIMAGDWLQGFWMDSTTISKADALKGR